MCLGGVTRLENALVHMDNRNCLFVFPFHDGDVMKFVDRVSQFCQSAFRDETQAAAASLVVVHTENTDQLNLGSGNAALLLALLCMLGHLLGAHGQACAFSAAASGASMRNSSS